MKTSFEQSF